jgi:peptidyl-prolyl cis-trans isomerase B (cyclophilin B)
MGSKKYSNKGYNATRQAKEQQAAAKANRLTVLVCLVAVLVIIAAVAAVIVVSKNASGSSSGQESQTAASTSTVAVDMSDIEAEIDSLSVSDFEETDQVTEYVKITVKDHGDIILRLRSDIAPITVANFQSLVSKGFYDGLTFHRVYKGFMIQGGDPNGDGTGGSDQTIKGEFSSNGVTNDLSHVRGVISMARSSAMDSASSQFFICHADSTFLDGNYASFGYVVAGLDTVDSVANVAVQENSSGEISSPLSAVVIEKICFVTEKAS